ncbi:MAG: Gfo/Idh/MocA family oxidoreductase [Gemmatimonadetes bacterium]|jgi:predicted dehydrogenase|nr:Gfo/Idh/MocA family oxidoreductase [Gemmatimonadota bacterium]MBT7863064.1 Gfo/Idh/MocA family oxidoreductase [Gemmatimonadota bacterium]
MVDPVRLAFVGCGNCLHISFGPVLSFVEGLDVVAAVDPLPENLAAARSGYGIAAGYESLEECLDNEAIDAALIAAPVQLHRNLAVMCAERGIHVMLEKPMARTVTECDEIISAHEQAGTTLMLGLMKRYNRSMLAVADLLESGSIGQIMGVRHNWDWGGAQEAISAGWRGSLDTWGGQWQDHGAHSVDLANWWAGPVSSVMAVFDRTEPGWEVENEYNVICTHQNGVRSTHQSTKNYHKPNEEHYLIFGDCGTVELRHRSTVWQYTTPYEVAIHRFGNRSEDHQPAFCSNWLEEARRFGQYKIELDHFVQCLREGSRPRTDGASGRAAVEVITAAYLSAIERREVCLPLTTTPDIEGFFAQLPARVPERLR